MHMSIRFQIGYRILPKVMSKPTSALPSDVRRWLCPAVEATVTSGLRPSCGPWPRALERKARTNGTARFHLADVGGAEPPPPIGRQSRVSETLLKRSHRSNSHVHIRGIIVKLVLGLISLLLISIPAFAQQKKSSCIECHLKLEDPRLSAPAKLFDNDIHRTRGL